MNFYTDAQNETDHLLRELMGYGVSVLRRAQIGDRLVAISDRRYGIGVDRNGVPEIAWCLVDLPKLRGDSQTAHIEMEEPELGMLPLTIPFNMAKYPIAYTQMQAFYEAEDGYEQDYWWEGLAVQRKIWEQNSEIANRPAENMNWYTAVAFCRWLSQRLGFEVRLPTEAEWWLAATLGDQTRIYPWGSDWNSAYANTNEGGLGRTTAVGMFPRGAAPCGTLDMIGNVWEWCLNEADKPNTVVFDSGWWKASRGGAFMDSNRVSVVSRNNVSPINSFAFCGFRVMSVHSM